MSFRNNDYFLKLILLIYTSILTISLPLMTKMSNGSTLKAELLAAILIIEMSVAVLALSIPGLLDE